jgi:formylglycine-generating enzyme required for sulfatase activity
VSGGGSNPTAGDSGQSQRHELFISYSHHDEHWLEKLRTHLKPLESLYGLERWDDSLIRPGDKWLEEIETALARAQVALLLVSPDFLASDFIQGNELPELLRSAEKDGLKIIWLPLRPSSWELYPDIRQYQAIMSPAKTLAQMSEVDQDLAMVEITKEIQQTFAELQAGKKAFLENRARELQDEINPRAEQEAQMQKAEDSRLSKTRADSKAQAEAKRWRAEAERLAREKEEWQRKVRGFAPSSQTAEEGFNSPAQQPEDEGRLKETESPCDQIQHPAQNVLIQITGSSAWLEKAGSKWEVKTASITSVGFKLELGDGTSITMMRIQPGTIMLAADHSKQSLTELVTNSLGVSNIQEIQPMDYFERLKMSWLQGQTSGRAAAEKYFFAPKRPANDSLRTQFNCFFLGQTPVTQEQWKAVTQLPKVNIDLNPLPSHFSGNHLPVEQVSWFEAVEFCQRLSRETKIIFTLPSEKQWEYACRAGTITPYSFGEIVIPSLVNFNMTDANGVSIGTQQTSDVDRFPANPWGLHDMHGNVWEWCLDSWHLSFEGDSADGSAYINLNTSKQDRRVIRGGSWYNEQSYCRSMSRSCSEASIKSSLLGFRVCCIPQD